MRIPRILLSCAAGIALLVGASTAAMACPFCSAPSLTLTEQLAQSDAAVLVQWAGATKPDENNSVGETVYEVVEWMKGRKPLKKGEQVALARYRAGSKGDLSLLLGTQGTVIEWSSPLEVTETSYNYIKQAPSPETPIQERLVYFIKFLEYPDPLVANDAYAEFANAPYKDIAPLADQMPLEKVRVWATSPDTPATRLGLYGLMLGLCGTESDAKLMRKKITEATQDFRLGIDGIMSGYLLLAGEDGLDLIEKTKLEDKKAPFSETYAAMQALRFMWTYAPERIEKDRLRKSMRTLLDRPELADLVIADLARWQDWSVQDQLMDLYGAEEYDIPSIKRAIIRYMLVSAKHDESKEGKAPAHVEKGENHLAALREKDPKTVKEAERFFILN